MTIKIEGEPLEVEYTGENIEDLVGFVAEEKPIFPQNMPFNVEVEGLTYLVEPVKSFSDDGKYHFSLAKITDM